VIDWDTHPASDGMDLLYGVSIDAGVKWTASLGNHDDDSDMNRQDVFEYVQNLAKQSGSGALIGMNPLGYKNQVGIYMI
jgi:hypothetical protein